MRIKVFKLNHVGTSSQGIVAPTLLGSLNSPSPKTFDALTFAFTRVPVVKSYGLAESVVKGMSQYRFVVIEESERPLQSVVSSVKVTPSD